MNRDEIIEYARGIFFRYGVDAAVLAVAEKVWDEAAQEIWHESGEGWNGEYPVNSSPGTPNPYRASEEA